MDYKELARELVFNSPLLLMGVKDKELIKEINTYLPYSTGFEIECPVNVENFRVSNFSDIPNIMDYPKYPTNESRFRIPSSINGIICLRNISEQLIHNLELNPLSGIHYHVDCTDWLPSSTEFDRYFPLEFVAHTDSRRYSNYISSELDSWEYKGTYNIRGISKSNHTWMRYNPLGTLEFRLGEMTFDYKLLITRITHCNAIVREVRERIGVPKAIDEIVAPNTKALLDYTERSALGGMTLSEMKSELGLLYQREIPMSVANDGIRNRIVKI